MKKKFLVGAGILEKLLPPNNKVFYDCFDKAALNCNQTATLFEKVLENGISEDIIVEARALKHQSNNYEREIILKLNSTFVTPIDREDIQVLASMLNKITKKIIQALMNLNIFRLESYSNEMIQQSKALVMATNELICSVSLLRTIAKIKEITESHSKMKEIEVYGDEILYRAMDALFNGEFKSLDVLKMKDIYKDIESALDKCFSVSDEILNIALKNN